MKRLLLKVLAPGWYLLSVVSWLNAAEEKPNLVVESLAPDGKLRYDLKTGAATSTHGVTVTYGDANLSAREITIDQQSGDVIATGSALLQANQAVWRGERLRYNFTTRQIAAEEFRIGQAPLFAAGMELTSMPTNQAATGTRALITTDDAAEPGYRIQARKLTIVPGQYFEARDATLYVGKVPVFYFPYYRRSLDRHENNFVFTPGYRGLYGPYLLGTYNWFWNTNLTGAFHLDYRLRRGVGLGPDLHYDAGRLGQGAINYYYTFDNEPGLDPNGVRLRDHRSQIHFTHQLTLRTNLEVKMVARKQSDIFFLRDFFETEYRRNIQPGSFLEARQLWSNFSLDLLAQPRLNEFYDTIERLPEVKLTGLRQQVGVIPVFYESESSVGYLRRQFADNATNEFAALRADTFHQWLLPQTFFGWLNVTPRVGGRFTHYGETEGLNTTTSEADRAVFNTGAEVSFKASRVWRGAESKFWDVKEMRHIVEPSVNYVYVPSPSKDPPHLPKFDYELTSYRLLPITFPDYNAIDSIDSQNVLRLGLRNKLQTKRADGVDNLLNWALYTDWRLKPRQGQTTFADLYSDLDLKPRSWLGLSSETRFDVANHTWREANHWLTVQPNDTWSLAVGHRYLRDDPAYGLGNNLIISRVYYRFNENWAARVAHHFEARDGTMEEQYYTLYRDLRSWTAALTFRVRENRLGPADFGVSVTFSLKAFPRFKLGDDRDTPALLLGS